MSYSGILVSTYGQTIHGGTYIAPANPYYNVATINVMSIFQSANTDAYNDIRVIKYSNRYLAVPTLPTGQAWSSDGKSVSLTTSAGLLSTYKLNQAWNISTVNTSTQVVDYSHPVLGAYGTTVTRETSIGGLSWGDNGNYLYTTGSVKDAIYQFKTSSPYNVANLEPVTSDTVEIWSAYNTQNVRVLDQGGYTSVNGRGIYVRPDGTSFYVTDVTSDKVFQYDMSTPFYTNTATMVANVSVVQQSAASAGLFFRDDGSQMYVLDQTRQCVFQWNLGTAWQANTAQCIPKANNAIGWTLDTTSSASFFTNPLTSATYTPNAMAFSRDGYQMIAADPTGDYIFTYNLATPWNVSTASAWTSNRFYSKHIDDTITGLAWQDDGMAFYAIGTLNRQVNKLNLPRAWDLTGATFERADWGYNALRFSGNYKDIYPGTGETSITAIYWAQGGMTLYTLGTGQDKIIQWEATESYNVATLTNSGKFVSTLLVDTAMSDMFIRSDGNLMYTLAPTNRTVVEWTFGTTWDISTAYPTPASSNPNVTGIRNVSKLANLTGMTGANGFEISQDGTRVMTLSGSTLYTYSLSTAFDITTASAITSKTLTASGFAVGAPAGITVSGDGYQVYVLGTTLDRIYWFTMGNPYDLTSISYTGVSLLVSGQEGTGTSIYIEPGGSYLYFVGSASDRINRYDFGWSNDLSTASYAGTGASLAIATFEATSSGICLSPDGTRIVISGSTNGQTVRQFNISNGAWNPAANSYWTMQSPTLGYTPTDIRYGDNGTKFYVSSASGISQYSVHRDWQWNFNTVESTATGFYFHGDGGAWWLVGSGTDRVYRFNMAGGWDINSSSYSGSNFLISAQSTTSGGLMFRNDGTEMYVVDSSTRYVYVYSLASNAWDFTPTAPVYTGKALNLSTAQTMVEGTGGGLTGAITGGGTCFVFHENGTKCYSFGSATVVNSGYFVTEYDFTRVINVAAQEATPQALFMNGSYACVIGNTTRRLFRYDFGWGWDIGTVSYNADASSPAVSATVLSAITGLTVTNDGRSAYLIGTVAPASYLRRFTMPEGSEWNFSTMTLSYTNVATTEIGASPTDIFKAYDDDYRYFVSHGSLIKQFTMYRTFYIGSQDTAPTDFWMNGGSLYVMGTTNDRVYQYSSDWDIDNATYTGNSFLVSGQEAAATGLVFTNDGTRFIVTGTSNAYEYRLDEAWNVTTARYYTPNNTIALSTYSGLTGIQGITLADNDKRFYVSGFGTTYYSVAELKFCKHYYTGTQVATGVDVVMGGDGMQVYIPDNTTRKIFKYDVGTWDVWNSNYAQQSSAWNAGETGGTSLVFSPDGWHFYVGGTVLDTIYQYDMTWPYDLATGTTNKSISIASPETGMTSLAFSSDGRKFFVTGSGIASSIKEYYTPLTFYVGTQATNGHGLTFSAGGNYMYVYDITSDTIKRYDVANGYDIGTASYVEASPALNAQDTNFYAIDVNQSSAGYIFGGNAGQSMFLLGSASTIWQYFFNESWNLQSGMTVGASLSISSFETNAKGLRFSWDGYNLYVVGLTTSGTTPTVWRIPYQYAPGAGLDSLLYWLAKYDINARTSRSLQQGGESNNLTAPTGISFSYDGTSMQVSDAAGYVYQYQLTLPWDITTATYKLAYNLTWSGTSLQDIYMSYYGDRFFTLDMGTDRVSAFTIGPV